QYRLPWLFLGLLASFYFSISLHQHPINNRDAPLPKLRQQFFDRNLLSRDHHSSTLAKSQTPNFAPNSPQLLRHLDQPRK
ncbi:MAG: hypothetical protein ACYTXI_43315, partial [Nostoc sp.]